MNAVNPNRQPAVVRLLPITFLLGFAVLGAPVAWWLQLVADYSLSAHACFPDSVPLATPIWGALWWILLGIECSALIVAFLAWLRASSEWRTRGGDHASEVVGLRRNRFLAKWALMISTLFTIAMIFTMIMLFIVPICDG